ncbi:MAG: hypothetical protein KAX60_01280 [Azonexus sp.]|jgi:hypothetical protein|nr:hypothetical protein [Azonexus sp.]MBV2193311.1 hypothetical protein [Azonexus sp.]
MSTVALSGGHRHRLAISAFRLGHGLAQQGQAWSHHGQINHAAAEHAIAAPAARIRQQLASRQIK